MKSINQQIGKTALITFPYHKASYCTNCNTWYPKAKNIVKCLICNQSLRLWPKKALNKLKYKKMLEVNEKQRPRTAKYKQNNKQKISKYNNEYYKKNKEELKTKKNYSKLLKASRKWKEKNREKVQTYRKAYYDQIEKPKRKANSEIVEVIQQQNR